MQEVKAAVAHSKEVVVLWVPAQRSHMLVLAMVSVELPQGQQRPLCLPILV